MSSFFTSSRVVGFHCGIIDRKVKRERERERAWQRYAYIIELQKGRRKREEP
jgi:hypothetical protein